MTENVLEATAEWFRKAVPQPNSKNWKTQLGCHFEEVNEMLMELETEDPDTQTHINVAKAALHALSHHFKTMDAGIWVNDENAVHMLDALCDQIVTAAGVAHMMEADIVGGLREVNRSNYSKFDGAGNPIFNDQRKIMKGPSYKEPDLTPFVST